MMQSASKLVKMIMHFKFWGDLKEISTAVLIK